MGVEKRPGYTLGEKEDAIAFMRIRSVERCCAFFRPAVERDSDILDCGCGPGNLTVGLAAWAPEGKTVGCDVAVNQLEGAKTLARTLGRDNVRFEKGDVFELPFEDERFDVVFSHALLCHVGSPEKALAEMKRVLRKGGTLAVRDVIQDCVVRWPRGDTLFDEVNRIFGVAQDLSGGDPNIGRRLGALLDEAGFHDVRFNVDFEQPETPAERRGYFDSLAGMLDAGDLGDLAVAQKWIEADQIPRIADHFREVTRRPGSIVALPLGQAVGRKPKRG